LQTTRKILARKKKKEKEISEKSETENLKIRVLCFVTTKKCFVQILLKKKKKNDN
jgi:hypothetical protein